MEGTIVFTPRDGSRGLLRKYWNFDEDTGIGKYRYDPLSGEEILSISLLSFLTNSVEIQEGTTFEDILMTIINDPLIVALDLVFMSDAGGSPSVFREFGRILKMEGSPNPRRGVDDIEYLMVHAGGLDITEDDEIPEGHELYTPEVIESLWDFSGWGPWDSNESGACGVEFTPICDLKHLPVKIDREFKIMRCHPYRRREDMWETVYTAVRNITVHDFIRAIVHEMTFCGIIEPGDRTIVDDAIDLLDELNSATVQDGPDGSTEFVNSSGEVILQTPPNRIDRI